MQHKVFLSPNNFIEIDIIGDLSTNDVSQICQGIDKLSIFLEDDAKKVSILVDLSQGDKTDISALSMAKIFAKILHFDKIACLQAKNAKMMQDILKAGHLENKMSLFQSRQEAETWLSKT